MMHVLQNTPRVLQNVGSSIVNKPGFFRDQSLILASLALVISRIVVANISAVKAQGTSEGPFRYRESIRTDMREIGGFLSGFVLLRGFQVFTQKALRKHLGVEVSSLSDGYSFKQLWQDLTSKTRPAAFNPKLAYSTDPFMAPGELKPLARLVSRVFDAPILNGLKEKAAAQVKTEGLSEAAAALAKNKAFIVNGVYKLAPILVGSIPSVALAGYFLERMTRDHSEQIVDAVSNRLGSKDEKPATLPPPTTLPPQPAPRPTVAAAASPAGLVQFGIRPFPHPNGAYPVNRWHAVNPMARFFKPGSLMLRVGL
ncbi:hypothetical protein [Vampirovibrio chlorellavorus]|uniref:hypothetical protein n=1 Tax=Vampirovibrio chlorellavorus TaxID=758823 RepID=UPI0026F20985|nr:hypothetical protein [Vampirovibrio chlorellavorus]